MAFTPLSKREGHEFTEGTFDVRGWEVKTQADDEKVGKIDDVLIDRDGNARYLDVDLGIFQKHVLLPIGQARVDPESDLVWVPGMTKDRFENIPEWEHDDAALTEEYEARLGNAYGSAYGDDAYYEHPDYASQHWGGTDRNQLGAGTAGSAAGPGALAGGVTGERIGVAAPADDMRAGDARGGRLAPIGDLDDYEVADHEPDPRGWKVIASDGREVGKVDDLIADTGAMKVRYLDVEMDDDLAGDDRHVLVPTGHVRLDDEGHNVRINAVSSGEVGSLPRYQGRVDRQLENQIRDRFASGYTGERRYEHPRYSAERFYGGRRGV